MLIHSFLFVGHWTYSAKSERVQREEYDKQIGVALHIIQAFYQIIVMKMVLSRAEMHSLNTTGQNMFPW